MSSTPQSTQIDLSEITKKLTDLTQLVNTLTSKQSEQQVVASKIANPKLIEYCKNGKLEEVKKLIAENCDVNILHDNYTPLNIAAIYDRKEIVVLLLEAKADPNLVDNEGRTALRRAAIYDHKEIVALLLDAKADPNLADNNKLTPLHMATFKDHKELVALLLAAKADPNLSNKDGDTPLHLAARNGRKEIVMLLLQKGAICDKENNEYLTPAEVAKSKSYVEIAKIIKKHAKQQSGSTLEQSKALTPEPKHHIKATIEKNNVKVVYDFSITDWEKVHEKIKETFPNIF